jgi:hypothetical protein
VSHKNAKPARDRPYITGVVHASRFSVRITTRSDRGMHQWRAFSFRTARGTSHHHCLLPSLCSNHDTCRSRGIRYIRSPAMGKDRQGCTRIQRRISVTESPSERHSVHTELGLLRSRIGVRDEKASLGLRAMAGSRTFPGSVPDGLCSLRPYLPRTTHGYKKPC